MSRGAIAAGRNRYVLALGLALLLSAGSSVPASAKAAPGNLAETPRIDAIESQAGPVDSSAAVVVAVAEPTAPGGEPAEPAPAPAPTPIPPSPPSVPAPSPAPAPLAPPAAPTEPSDAEVVAALVADLGRYANLNGDDVRREINIVTPLLNRQRTDANRVRLAVLYTLVHTVQDDQRALQLLETVTKSNPGNPAVKALAGVIQVQVVERLRAVREEQQKADAAVQKLEQLRVLERSLLRDRLRSGGGGAGGGSGGGGGGGR